MLVIQHRINKLEVLSSLPINVPVEVDIHAYGERLIVHHDAMQDGPDFEEWLAVAGRRFAILNVKEEGIEEIVCSMAVNSKLQDFFLLDLTFPALMKMVRKNETRIALRVSEYEHFSTAIRLGDKIGWVWLDCFDGFPLSKDECNILSRIDAKICLVSPELHGPHRSHEDVKKFQSILYDYRFNVDAVCTKQPGLWRQGQI